jgi:glycine cleavage system H protein
MKKQNDDIYFTQDHLWVRFHGAVAYIGLTDFFQSRAGNIMNVSLYSKEGTINQFEDFAIIDSRRGINRLKMPVEGKTIETNIKIITVPSIINTSPMDEGWLIKIAVISPPETFNLMTPMEYEIYMEEQNQLV